jgi:hypothetical protein
MEKNLKGKKFIENLSDFELKQAGTELLDFYETSVLKSGNVRELQKILSEEIDPSFCLTVAEDMITREIVRRFCRISD